MHARLLSADDDATGLPTSRLHGQHTRTTADNDDGRIPTTNDLAQSFLESEPREKKAELEAAISSQSQHLQRPSGTPSDDEEEEDLGIGSEGVSLPSFIAAFLKGVVDRLQVKVTDVTSRVEMDLRQDAPIKRAPEDRPDKVAAVFTLRELSVGAVIDGASGQEEEGAGSGKVPRREISLSAIQALLVSEPVVFSNYARFTADPSPPSTEPSQSDHDHDPVLVGDDYGELSESRLFSHEEAESMYMSAMSYASSDSTPSMPGSWDTSEAVSYHTTVPAASTSASTSAVASTPANDGAPTPTIDRPDTPVVRQGSRDVGAPSAPTSPHTMSSRPVETSSEDPEVARRILDISKITVLVPTAEQPTEINEPDTPSSPVRQSPRPESADARLSASMTSSFMDSSFRATTFNLPRRSRTDSLASIRVEDFAGEVSIQESPASKPSNAIEINVEDVSVQFDIATGWLLVKVSQKVLGAFATKSDQKRPESSTTPTANKSQNLRFSLGNCSVKFLEHLIGFPYHGHHAPQNDAPVQGIILRAAISGLKADVLVINELSKLNVNLGKFVLGYASEDFISFNEDLKMRESVRDVLAPTHAELSLSIVKSPSSARATITTLPLHLNLNIQRLEEILGWFGGLSTILELGSSISSMSTVRGDEPRFSTSSRGVHFAGVPDPRPKTPQTTSSSWKVNVRLGGLVVDLVGEKCSLRLKTTAVKMVSRFEGVGLQIDKAKLSGPLSTEDDGDAPGKISFNNIRIEYLFSPKEVDLDRLLYLITPSKDKYGDDDDIMLDTLLRQRRQGSVVRVTVAAVKLIVSDTQELRLLSHLPAEIGKLSNVAKYLPDDDRPGIMTLALIREFDGQLHVDNNVGDLQVRSQDLEVAHVTLPALIAAQIKRLSLTRNGDEELVGEALQPPAEQGIGQPPLPMIMARYIADDVDPTVKVKLHNLRAEYIVSTLAAFLGLGGNSTAQEFAVGMANSVASLADLPVTHRHQTSSAPSEISRPDSTKPFRLAVASRDCVIGLNPRDMPAKGLIVLTYAKFTSVLQEDEPSELVFDIKKATLMIIDDVRNIDSPENPRRKIPGNSPQVQAFADMGYVPVTYMSSALADVKIYNTEEGNKSVDVELRDDLLILETCADSTKTLINLFNGLVPPTPPSTAVKYRTEVMPLQDMLASFTGDAYATEPVSDPEALAAVPDEDDERGIADELEYVSDFYPAGPGAAGDPEHATGLAADSSQPGHLLDSVHSEYNITLDSSVTGLEFRDDHFAKQSAVGGTAHRWDSTHNTYELTNDVKISSSPLRVRVRDVHIIWNLFDGYDWRRTRDAISKAVKDVEARAMERRARAASRLSPDEEEEESVIGDFLFNSIYIGIPANRDPRELSQAINNNIDDLASETGSYATQTTVTGATARRHSSSPSVRGKKLRLSRSKHHKMTFELQGVSADVVVFPPGSGETQSSIDVRVNNLEIFDHIPTSTWKKFATYMHDAGERESGTGMVHLEILIVRPVQELAASEIVLKVVASTSWTIDSDLTNNGRLRSFHYVYMWIRMRWIF